jgi:inositol phosphorylceramide synthase catalytic subunit
VQPDKLLRWDYDYVEVGEVHDDYPNAFPSFYEEFRPSPEIDKWTTGSSSSFSSGARSPSVGTRSPVDESTSTWEGDTLASGSDHESGR